MDQQVYTYDNALEMLKEDKNEYEKQYEEFLNDILNDPEEADYEGWHKKHYNVTWFLDLWNKLYVYDDNIISSLIKEGKINYILLKINRFLLSRKVNYEDKKFIKYFGNVLDTNFAKLYNITYKEYSYSKL